MIVTLDGPASSGKSLAARRLADRLGWPHLNTGAMYRAVTLAALERGVDLTDGVALAALAAAPELEFTPGSVRVFGRDPGPALRSRAVDESIKLVADCPAVRAVLVARQQALAGEDLVTEGRDQGTIVFPAAALKIYLTASLATRARRRLGDVLRDRPGATLDEVMDDLARRDADDQGRAIGALRIAADAVQLHTDDLNPEEVTDRLVALVEAARAAVGGGR
ncbi:MAG: (d)CMP kinase [Planctomycetota bacterium]